jgi:thioredoxin-related protein
MTRMRTAVLALFLMLSIANAQEHTSSFSYVNDYEQAVETKDKKILVVFGADWCKYCHELKRDLNLMHLDNYIVCVVDVDVKPDLKKKYSCNMLPCSVILLNKKEISRKSGYKKQDYGGWLEKYGK